MNIAIKGIGVVGGFGCGVEELETALASGSRPQNSLSLKTLNGSLEIPALTADTNRIFDFVSKSTLRRLDHYIRLALLGSHLALENAGLLKNKRRRMGIIVATGYGSTCNMMDLQQALASHVPVISPTRFANSVHNAAATHIAILLDEMGPSLSVNDFDMSIPAAFLAACQWLGEGRVECVLVGGVDEYCRALGYNWHRRYCSGIAAAGAPGSLSAGRAVIGEGACFFVLERQAGASPYGIIKAVRMGSTAQTRKNAAADDGFYFLSLDAGNEVEARYAACLPRGVRVAAYSHLYGAVPIGAGFDIAIAALSLKAGKVYASDADNSCLERLNVVRSPTSLGGESIRCMKLGIGGIVGSLQLVRG